MQTIFSYIVQKRFSQVNEDVATDALAFILESNQSARKGMMKLLRGIVSDIPDLHFRTQQTEGSIRPDMWGYDGDDPRVFVENKFWAGLTDNQPVSYLEQLAQYTQPTILLMVVPDARVQTVWRELRRRLKDAGITISDDSGSSGVVRSVATNIGPMFALTSWPKLFSILELEVAGNPSVQSDILQLRALCEAADHDAFVPMSPEDVTDQRIPILIQQLNTVVRDSVESAVSEGVLDKNGLRPQASWERIGRYVRFGDANGVGVWFGIHFDLWKNYGGTPLWLVFTPGEWGRAQEVRSLLEPWAVREGVFTTFENGDFAVAVDVAVGEEKDQVVKRIVDFVKTMKNVLKSLIIQD